VHFGIINLALNSSPASFIVVDIRMLLSVSSAYIDSVFPGLVPLPLTYIRWWMLFHVSKHRSNKVRPNGCRCRQRENISRRKLGRSEIKTATYRIENRTRIGPSFAESGPKRPRWPISLMLASERLSILRKLLIRNPQPCLWLECICVRILRTRERERERGFIAKLHFVNILMSTALTSFEKLMASLFPRVLSLKDW